MPEKIIITNNKTLKLTNALIRKIKEDEYSEFGKIVVMMEDYIKAKGAQPLGPLIQHSSVEKDEQGQVEVHLSLIRQANKYINHIESPYTMESIIRIRNCLYSRFVGEESQMKYAYDKLWVTAYEEGIKLKGDNYTIFVESTEDQMTADIFMECVNHE
jgi:hypothetical protein